LVVRGRVLRIRVVEVAGLVGLARFAQQILFDRLLRLVCVLDRLGRAAAREQRSDEQERANHS